MLLDTALPTNVWFDSILAPTRTQNWAGTRLGYVPLAEDENYHYINPSVQQIRALQGWLHQLVKKEGFRKPCLETLRFHEATGGNTDLNTRTPSAAYVVPQQAERKAEPSPTRRCTSCSRSKRRDDVFVAISPADPPTCHPELVEGFLSSFGPPRPRQLLSRHLVELLAENPIQVCQIARVQRNKLDVKLVVFTHLPLHRANIFCPVTLSQTSHAPYAESR